MTATDFRTKADAFTKAYVEAALWSSTDDNDKPLDDEHGIEDIAETTLDRIVADCAKFQKDNAEWITNEYCLTRLDCDKQAGYDFWLTRNGHGAGFWETSDWAPLASAMLDQASQAFGECSLYIGDDSLIYA